MSESMRPLSDAFAVTLGLILGSFVNVCIYRLPRELSVVRPRSRCPACARSIPWYDNIPLLSFLVLRGRCRACGASIAARYPLVEAGTALVSWVVFLRFGLGAEYLVYFLYAAALLTLSVVDLDYRIIPDEISVYGLGVGLLLALCSPWLTLVDPLVSGWLQPAATGLTGELQSLARSAGTGASGALGVLAICVQATTTGLLRLLDSVVGMLVGGGFLYGVGALYEKARKQEGIGGGDIKLMAMAGAFTGWEGALFTIFGGSLVASVVGVFLMARRRTGGQTPIPFGPFLSAASFLYLLCGDRLIQSYLNLLRPL